MDCAAGNIHGMLQLTIVVTVLNLLPLVFLGLLPAGRLEHQVYLSIPPNYFFDFLLTKSSLYLKHG